MIGAYDFDLLFGEFSLQQELYQFLGLLQSLRVMVLPMLDHKYIVENIVDMFGSVEGP